MTSLFALPVFAIVRLFFVVAFRRCVFQSSFKGYKVELSTLRPNSDFLVERSELVKHLHDLSLCLPAFATDALFFVVCFVGASSRAALVNYKPSLSKEEHGL